MVWFVAGSTHGEQHEPARPAVHPAVVGARRVVGLYGDPDVTWSVLVAVRLRAGQDPGVLRERLVALVEQFPHLGVAPDVARFEPDHEGPVLDAFANEPYADQGPLLRVALSADGRDVLLAAHHGVVDGLGLLGAASRVLDIPLPSSARGIRRTAEPRGFLRRAVGRLVEALLRPPARVQGDLDAAHEPGDWLVARTVVAARPGSAALVRTAVDVVRRTNGARDHRHLVVSMGLSRRPGTPAPAPDRDTAYVRLRADRVGSTVDAREVIEATRPEPAFPVSDGGGLGPRVVRLLSRRLGATVLVSNLGRIDSPEVESVRFWPVPTGPAGVCLGLASTPTSTTLTVRARRGWFSRQATELLGDAAAVALVEAAG